MKTILALSFAAIASCSFTLSLPLTSAVSLSGNIQLCTIGHNGQVQAGDVRRQGHVVGNIIMINRATQRVKAKYFAWREGNTSVHDRYDEWRKGRNVVLISSGAYANGFQDNSKPVGITVMAVRKLITTTKKISMGW